MAKAHDTLTLLRQFPVEILPTDKQAVFSAAHVKANHALSHADAFVAAALQKEDAVVITNGPEFQSVKELITIELLELKILVKLVI